MHSFKDTTGREWNVTINPPVVKRVRELAGVDLMTTADTDLIARLAFDPVTLADVLFAVIAPQAEAEGVTAEQFAEAFAGDVIDEAATALVDALAAFNPRWRTVLPASLAKLREIDNHAMDGAMKLIDETDPAAAFAR